MLKNMKIGARMISAFVIVIILSVALAVLSILELTAVATATENLATRPVVLVNKTWDMRESLVKIEKDILRATLEPTKEKTQAQLDAAQAEADLIYARIAEIEPMVAFEDTDDTTVSGKADLLKTVKDAMQKMDPIRNKLAVYALNLQNQEALDTLDNEYLPELKKASDAILSLSDGLQIDVETFHTIANDTKASATTLTIGFAIVQVVVAIAIALMVTNSITKPLNRIKEAAEEIAKGHIDISVDYKAKDELGNLADGFRAVIGALNKLNTNLLELKTFATEGRMSNRTTQDGSLQGAYLDTVRGVEGIMDTFVGHFDSLPVAVTIVDNSKSVLFENKTVGVYKNTVKAEDINTQGKEFTNESGKVLGSLLVGVDMTDVNAAKRESEAQAAAVEASMKVAEKQAIYQAGEVEKLIAALDQLAKGSLSVQVQQGPYDQDTKDIYTNFKKLGDSLEQSCANIRSYIEELSEILGSIADKNLTGGIDREYLGDFSALKTSINNIADTLNEIFGEIASATNQVQSGSSQVANSAQTLAQGSSEQASAVEQISATMAEVAAQTRSNADNANKANDMSLSAKKDAETGSHQMGEMVNAMDAIAEASKGIANIIKVIEDIAFQTNILALNAAVEAARAGEHGKGFAVVAEEVRNLAARSAAAAKETTEMIDNSLTRVEAGSKIANDTAHALGKIVEGVTGTVDIVGTIAEASSQQATAIAQIENGVEQISKVTQANTATAEESASASEEMAGQAQMLQGMVGEFHLKGSNSVRGNSHKTRSIPAPKAPASKPKASSSQVNDVIISLGDDDFATSFDNEFGKY